MLVGCLLTKIGVSASGAILVIPRQTFDEECRMTRPTKSTSIFAYVFLQFINDLTPDASLSSVVEIVVQTLILGLTFSKQFLIIRDRWMRSPIASLVYRDGMISYIVIIGQLFLI